MVNIQRITPLHQPSLCQLEGSSNFQHNSRIDWVDIAKALGLFLVFLGHTLYGGSHIANVLNRAIYSFHMPMFFILSGYVAKPDSTTFQAYINKKFKRLLLPAILLYVLALPIYFVFYHDWSDPTLLMSVLKRIFYIKGECVFNKPVWFFFCLFQILVLIKLFDLLNAKTIKLVIVGICCLLLSWFIYTSGFVYFKLFGFDKCILGLFFYVCGMILRKTKYDRYLIIIGLILLPIWFYFGVFLNPKVRMYDMHLANFWFFIVSGVTGSLCFFSISKVFEFWEKNSFIKEYAKWTVFIVGSHYVLVIWLHQIMTMLSLNYTYVFDVICLGFVLLSLVVYKPICRWLEKHFPIIV